MIHQLSSLLAMPCLEPSHNFFRLSFNMLQHPYRMLLQFQGLRGGFSKKLGMRNPSKFGGEPMVSKVPRSKENQDAELCFHSYLTRFLMN